MFYLWGNIFLEFICDYLCCILFCNGFILENERGLYCFEIFCSFLIIIRLWMWGFILDRFKGLSGICYFLFY